ncbi:MAG: hypothetical protein LBD55_05030 [Treponema sp.]|jgi:predicted RNA-binding Zn-ribbon protein involved in translation (DUF1610 family)|nr:hypothetical protein [Treponema sp.]
MDYDDWLKEKEGGSPYKGLEDAVGGIVGRMYEDVSLYCPECGASSIEMVNSHSMHCESCGHYWTV